MHQSEEQVSRVLAKFVELLPFRNDVFSCAKNKAMSATWWTPSQSKGTISCLGVSSTSDLLTQASNVVELRFDRSNLNSSR